MTMPIKTPMSSPARSQTPDAEPHASSLVAATSGPAPSTGQGTPPTLVVHVVGIPAPQGSHRAFVVKGRPVVTQDNKRTKPWRQDVTAAAQSAVHETQGFEPYTGPVAVVVTFYLPRPGYHYRTGKRAGELKPTAPWYGEKKPDVDKLLRSTLDALTNAGVFRDDAQVAVLTGVKRYADRAPGATITITALVPVPAALSPSTAEAPHPSPRNGCGATPTTDSAKADPGSTATTTSARHPWRRLTSTQEQQP